MKSSHVILECGEPVGGEVSAEEKHGLSSALLQTFVWRRDINMYTLFKDFVKERRLWRKIVLMLIAVKLLLTHYG